MAAQAIVSTSYDDPIKTVTTNVVGTTVILEALRQTDIDCVAVIITSDKCYENVEWEYGYRENDTLGGKDMYSASKACAEILYASYFHSFLKNKANLRVCSARVGNVIGGGDWAKDRIVVDMFKSWSEGQSVIIRSPEATRPWQHVLEPLSGYLHLGAKLTNDESINGQSFNFGPKSEQNRTVIDLADDLFIRLKDQISAHTPYEVVDNKPFHEAGLLKLCCDKASMRLNWQANLHYEQCVDFIGEWYSAYLHDDDMSKFTSEQIRQYCNLAKDADLIWTK
jgi:CDP-glucose 4,6-dehydratase